MGGLSGKSNEGHAPAMHSAESDIAALSIIGLWRALDIASGGVPGGTPQKAYVLVVATWAPL